MRKVGAEVLIVKSETDSSLELWQRPFHYRKLTGAGGEAGGGNRDGKKSAFQWENPGEVQTLQP